jgi:hypothetical protein
MLSPIFFAAGAGSWPIASAGRNFSAFPQIGASAESRGAIPAVFADNRGGSHAGPVIFAP